MSDPVERDYSFLDEWDATPASELGALRYALVEAVTPLEVIAAQDRAKPYRELSRGLIADIDHAIEVVRAALLTDEQKRYLRMAIADLDATQDET